MDRARSFATIGRALYMAHGCSQVPDFRKSAETLSQPIGARTARAHFKWTLRFPRTAGGGIKREPRPRPVDLSRPSRRLTKCRLHLNPCMHPASLSPRRGCRDWCTISVVSRHPLNERMLPTGVTLGAEPGYVRSCTIFRELSFNERYEIF